MLHGKTKLIVITKKRLIRERNKEEQRGTNKVLNENYRILKRILGDKKDVNVTADILRGAQYDLRCFTNYSTTSDKFSRYHVYNYCIVSLGNNNYKIVKDV
jgi:hypothetical protein